MKNKTTKRVLSCVLAFSILATVGIGAYLTDTDVKEDVYTIGNVQAEIVSLGDMQIDNVGALLPGTVHTYERAATNTGINDAYVFMSLTIPYEMVGVSEADGTQIGERVRQLFIPGHADGFIGSEWKLVDVGYIGQYEIENNGQYCGEHDQYSAVVGDTITYVYGYIGDNADGSLKALASGETTANLVETMELTNLYHADKINGEISTKLYAIQSNNVNGGLTDVNGVWAVINKAISGAENDATATLTYSINNSRTGDAVGYAPLKLVDENGNVVATSVANESGNGQFKNVPAGDYAIETAVGDLAVSGATGYAMRRVAANITITEDASVNLEFTAPSTTLIKGTEFNALIPADVTSIVFTTGAAGAGAFDVSEAKDGSVMAWVDGTTMYVASEGLIYANSNCDGMFKFKRNLTYIGTENIDFSSVCDGYAMFWGCGDVSAAIEDMNFSNMYIAQGLFFQCTWLTEYTIPEGLGIIDDWMFEGTGITEITIPSSVKSIRKYAFRNCRSLTTVVIEDGVTYIDEQAFANCNKLKTITIPSTFAVVDPMVIKSMFPGTSSLTEIIVSDNNPYYTSVDGVLFTKDMKTLITYPAGKTDTHYVVPEGVEIIGYNAFQNCTSLTNISIPSSVTEIGNGAFANCTSLTNISIPSSVKSIGNSAFINCSSLKSIAFAENSKLQSIGQAAFKDCTSLTEIIIPEEVTRILPETFNNCIALSSVELSSKTTVIGNMAFCYCKNLSNITIPASVTLIDTYAFYDCTNLETVNIPASVTEIRLQAFKGCTSLKTINFAGTEEQWNAITFGNNWNANVPADCVINFLG